MLSTEELKKYICNEIQGVLGEVSCSNLFFDEGTNDSIEGTYIFNKNNEYPPKSGDPTVAASGI